MSMKSPANKNNLDRISKEKMKWIFKNILS